MALIGKAASQGNLYNLQVAAGQHPLRSGDADAPHIFADGAPEMVMKLAADLDGMSSGTTREFLESETRVLLLAQHFSDTQQPGRDEAAALRRVLPVGEQELQDDCLDVQP
jgi:hypothetical protein